MTVGEEKLEVVGTEKVGARDTPLQNNPETCVTGKQQIEQEKKPVTLGLVYVLVAG